MRGRTLVTVLAGVLAFLPCAHGQQPLLQLQGQPYFGGSMTLHVTAPSDIGDIVWLGVGLDPLPLDAPVPTSKGQWYIGNLLIPMLIGAIPSNGRLDMPFTMPPATPGIEGTVIALQAYVPPALSNPATLPLDLLYYSPAEAVVLTSPQPMLGADFGDRVAAGDLNGDGAVDVVVGAWFEDFQGIDKSGRAYVFWGPAYTSSIAIDPPTPHPAGEFGSGLAVSDFDGDGLADLMVSDGSGYPLSPLGPGHLHFYIGGATFSPTPSLSVASVLSGLGADSFGRRHAIGDLNGDGFVDVAVGLANAPVGSLTLAGQVHVYWGPTFSAYQELFSPEPEANANFGTSLAIGDFDGDGIMDLVEGSDRVDAGGVQDVGNVHAFKGGSLGLLLTIPYPLTPVAFASFGGELETADIDLDGIAEIVVSDELDHVFVFEFASLPEYSVIPKPYSGSNPLGAFGVHIAAGDSNGDGLVDLAIGNTFEGPLSCPIGDGGEVQVALGPYFATFHNVYDKARACGDLFGFDFTAVDLDGDGSKELIVGASVADDGGLQNSGHITILFTG